MNRRPRLRQFIVALILLVLLLPVLGQTTRARQLRIATIAPQGSIWAKRFDQFNAAVRAKTGGAVYFKIYYGGVMGDDQTMYREMRIGQLQGAGMTVTGLSEIVPDFRVLSIPFLFDNYAQVDAVTHAVLPLFKREFAQNNLELLTLTEVGFVYTMSSLPLSSASDLKKAKVWVPDGDPLSLAFLQQAGVSPLPLTIADVLTSLQTGLINTVFSSYYGAIVLQWFTKTRYVSDIPFGYAYGGLVLDGRTFNRLSAKERGIIKQEAAVAFGKLLLKDTRKSNREAFTTLQRNGIKVLTSDAQSRKAYLAWRDAVIKKNEGKLFSKEALGLVQRTLANFKKK